MALEMATTFVTEEQESVFVNPTGLEANVNHLVSYTLFPFDTFKSGDIHKSRLIFGLVGSDAKKTAQIKAMVIIDG